MMKNYFDASCYAALYKPIYSFNSPKFNDWGWFWGRLWYKPVNYTVGSYSAYTVCGEQKQLYSWGDNSYYQLGYQGVSNSVVPLATTGMNEVAYYSTGYLMGVIKTDHTGWVWGKVLIQALR